MFDCWVNGGKFDREPVILRTITSVILDDVLATCFIYKFRETKEENKSFSSLNFKKK